MLVIVLWLSWGWVFTDFERLLGSLPYLASAIIAVLLAACFRFEQRVFPNQLLAQTAEEQPKEIVIDAHPDDRINM